MEDKTSIRSEPSGTTQSSYPSKQAYSVFAKIVPAFAKGITYIANVAVKGFSFLANVAVVVGIVFAVYQIRQTNDIDKRRIAIEAVGQARSIETLRAIRRLNEAVQAKRIDKGKEIDLADDLNHVMHIYDHVAIIYISGIADRCIIKNSIYEGAKEASAIGDALSYPAEYKNNINSFLKMVETEQERCDVRFSNSTVSK